jgi:hypothetical protein
MWARVPTFVREDGTIEFSSLIPENKTLTQMKLCAVSKANSKKDLFRETTINAVESAIQNANVSKGEVAAVLVFICCIRRWMGEEHLFDITLDFNTKDRWEKKQAIVNLPTYNKLKDALKNNTISDVLRKIFEEGGYSLSTEAVIYRVDDNEWKIWDGKDEYIIMALKEPEEKLEVYQGIGELDLDAIKDVVGDDVPIIGFYTYGEQMSSLRGPGRLEISCTVMIISQVVVNQTFKVTFRDEKIKTVVAEVESESRSLSKRDLLRELKDYFEVRPEKIKDIEDAFDSVLNDFTKKKYGVPMEEQTKQFLKNELVYLMLMLKEKRGGT